MTDDRIPREGYYSTTISDYCYSKVMNIENKQALSENKDFTDEDIEEYNIPINNDDSYDISTTRKLIKYLKSLIEVKYKNISAQLENINTQLNNKLNNSDYIIDRVIKDSDNPVRNKAVLNEFNTVNRTLENKSNIGHKHNIDDVNGLTSKLNDKVSKNEFNSHISNTKNPHNVTLSQLGFTDSGWDEIPIMENDSGRLSDFPICRRYGKVVVLRLNCSANQKVTANTTLFTLKPEYRPTTTIWGFGISAGKVIAVAVNTSGKVAVAPDIPMDANMRISECYFCE